jgi:hypothetical protein
MAWAALRTSGATVGGRRPMRSFRVSRSTSPASISARMNSWSERRPKPPVTATVSFEAHRSWISGKHLRCLTGQVVDHREVCFVGQRGDGQEVCIWKGTVDGLAAEHEDLPIPRPVRGTTCQIAKLVSAHGPASARPDVCPHRPTRGARGVVRLQATRIRIAAGQYCHDGGWSGVQERSPGIDVVAGAHPIQLAAGPVKHVRRSFSVLEPSTRVSCPDARGAWW